jgi:hypothetical protein
MAEPGNYKFLQRWQKKVRSDPRVRAIKGLLAVALLISTEANRDGTRALMSQQDIAEELGCPNQQPNGASGSCGNSDIWRLQREAVTAATAQPQPTSTTCLNPSPR